MVGTEFGRKRYITKCVSNVFIKRGPISMILLFWKHLSKKNEFQAKRREERTYCTLLGKWF